MNALTDRAAWLEERRSYIGATDLSAILGLNPYQTPLGVYCDKLGIVEPQAETAAMKRGLRIEPYIAQLYGDHGGWIADKWESPVRHAEKRYLGVNPDYFVPGPDAPDTRGAILVECKSHLPWLAHYYGEPGTDQAPEWEVVQAQWQMHLTGFHRCDIAVLLGLAEEDFRVYTVLRDPEIGAMLEAAADEFWHSHILAEEPPPVTGMQADAELLKRLYPYDRDTTVSASEEIEDAVDRLRQARKARKAYETAETAEENVIKAFMGDAACLETSLGRFTWRTAKSGPVSWKAVAEEMGAPPALVAKHTGPGSRRFLTPFKGE